VSVESRQGCGDWEIGSSGTARLTPSSVLPLRHDHPKGEASLAGTKMIRALLHSARSTPTGAYVDLAMRRAPSPRHLIFGALHPTRLASQLASLVSLGVDLRPLPQRARGYGRNPFSRIQSSLRNLVM